MFRAVWCVCIIIAQLARVTAFAMPVAYGDGAHDAVSVVTSAPVSAVVGDGLVAQLEMLTKVAALACALVQPPAPRPVAPLPLSHTTPALMTPGAGLSLHHQARVQSDTVVVAQMECYAADQQSNPRVHAPPGTAQVRPSHLFALARGGLSSAAEVIFSYGTHPIPHPLLG